MPRRARRCSITWLLAWHGLASPSRPLHLGLDSGRLSAGLIEPGWITRICRSLPTLELLSRHHSDDAPDHSPTRQRQATAHFDVSARVPSSPDRGSTDQS